MKKTILYLSIMLFLAGCEKKTENYPNADQQILFQVEYNNWAWGYSHDGIVIDSSGNVRYFKFPKNWNYPDTAGYISESDMNKNLQQLDTVLFTIEKNTLLKYFSLLKDAAEGQISKPVNRMFDAGETTYSGFLYDLYSNRYKHILIKMVGDWSRDNDSSEAEEIYNWLLNTRYHAWELMSQIK
jgi:hypothetical protein